MTLSLNSFPKEEWEQVSLERLWTCVLRKPTRRACQANEHHEIASLSVRYWVAPNPQQAVQDANVICKHFDASFLYKVSTSRYSCFLPTVKGTSAPSPPGHSQNKRSEVQNFTC